MEKIYDVAVIGGGPGGYYGAVRLAQLGAKVVVLKRTFRRDLLKYRLYSY